MSSANIQQSNAHFLRAGLTALFLSLLSACSTFSKHGSDDLSDNNWRTDSTRFDANKTLSASNNWQYAGKVGVTVERGREQASINWQYRDQANEVRLFGPLGIGAIKIEFDQYGVVLSDNKGVLHRGSSAQELLTRIVGWPIPVEALSHWLFVTPLDDAAFRYQVNEAGQVSLIEQGGWRVSYTDYRPYNDILMPRKIHAAPLPQANLPEVEVKLVTREWKW